MESGCLAVDARGLISPRIVLPYYCSGQVGSGGKRGLALWHRLAGDHDLESPALLLLLRFVTRFLGSDA